MANTKSAEKSYKQANRRRVVNLRRVRTMREAIKDTRALIVEKDAKKAEASLPAMYQAIDKAVKRGIIKPNTAARKKSRIAQALAKVK